MRKMRKRSEKPKYVVGEELTINDIKWKVESIRQRFGMLRVYDMVRPNTSDSFSIETDSLETMLRVYNV